MGSMEWEGTEGGEERKRGGEERGERGKRVASWLLGGRTPLSNISETHISSADNSPKKY